MDPLLTRILLSILLWPVALVLYISLFIAMQRELSEEYAFIWTGVGVGFVVCSWLIVVWKPHIRWTPKRRWQTFLTIPAAIAVGIVVDVLGNWFWPYGRGPFSFFGTLVSLVSWPVMAVLVWRESSEERQQRRTTAVSCPNCGYDLRGLSECRCPECGQQYTVDQLCAAQPRPTLELLHESAEHTLRESSSTSRPANRTAGEA